MSKEILAQFLEQIDISQIHINDKLPFIWIFGSGAAHVKNIDDINNKLSPSHAQFSLYDELESNRAKFFQWILQNSKNIDIANYIRIPEQYPEWANFRSKYTNLVDFELDIISLSRGAIIFSESIGSYVEIGMVACKSEIHKNILVVAPSPYLEDKHESFFKLGAILKIQENQIGETSNVWALDNHLPTADKDKLSNEFERICNHTLEIITNNSKTLFSASDKTHISLLLLDLIDLFPSNTKSFYSNALKKFEIEIQKSELDKMISLLKILDLIQENKSGNNEKLKIKNRYSSCISYKGKNKPFHRNDFIIERSGE